MTAALFSSLGIASVGFSAIRLSMGSVWRDVVGIDPPHHCTLRILGIAAIMASASPWTLIAGSVAIGLVSWFFCLLPLSALPLIVIWPFQKYMALTAPAAIFAMVTVLVLMAT